MSVEVQWGMMGPVTDRIVVLILMRNLCWVSTYVIPSHSEPTEFFRLNQSSTVANEDFANQALEELCAHCRAIEVTAMPYVCSLLSVLENRTGKESLVVNLPMCINICVSLSLDMRI